MRLNIQSKLFILLVGMTALILAGVLYAITITVSEMIEQRIISNFNERQEYFQKQQSLIFDRLTESCYLIGENSTFKANVEIDDPATVYNAVMEFANFTKIDLFIVTDEQGKVLARLDQPNRYGDYITDRSSVVRALNGVEPELNPDWAELWAIDDFLFQVASVPLYYGDYRIIGSISLGTLITRVEAMDLKGDSDIDISMFLGDMLIATTMTDSLTSSYSDSLTSFNKRHHELTDSVLAHLEPSHVISTQLMGEDVYAFISPIGEGEPAHYIATVPKSIELKILDAIQENILIIAGISLAFTIILAFFLGRTFSLPILRLVKGMNKVKKGDLAISVPPTTKDEIGLLTSTFNEMIVGLRERLNLMKYVGSHTIDMIQTSSQDEVSLGGDRKELAVLFSDVRGFTAYSENRSPEEVIQMLNRYLGYQAELVTKHYGSVDKFVGDEMVALFFGEDAIERAVDCAIEIQQMSTKRQETDNDKIQIGVGLNYGPVILGNMGAKERMDYTVIGATVNLGARLCASAGPGQILIRKDLVDRFEKSYKLGECKMMSFKGFSKTIEIIEVLSE
jgi:class 3 adenylate cyclase